MSSVSVELARSGHSVLKKNERFLASSFDPIKEAKQWAQKILSGLAPEADIVILGLGCGYHVAELEKIAGNSRQVYVVENDGNVIRQALAICPSLSNVHIVCETDWQKLVEHFYFRNLVSSGIFHIAVHGPSYQLEEMYYASVEKLLRARDHTSFLIQLKTRPDLAALVDGADLAEFGNEPISIKTLQKLFQSASVPNSNTRERALWRILEELVA